MMLSPDRKKALLTAKPFQYLQPEELDRLVAFCSVVTFSAGETVLHQGKKNLGLYVILDGRVLVTGKTLGKNAVTLATLDQGDFIGEVSLIEKSPCTATVTAISKLQCLLITAEFFDTLSAFFPETKYKIVRAINENILDRVKNLRVAIIELMNHSAMVERSLFSSAISSLVKYEVIDFDHAEIDSQKIKESVLFSQFSQDEFTTLLNHSELIHAQKNCALIFEKQKEPDYFIVLRGAVQVSLIDHNKVAKLLVLSPMEFFGNISPAIANYATCERAILLKISALQLSQLKADHILLWYKIFNLICHSYVVLERAANKLNLRLNSELYNV